MEYVLIEIFKNRLKCDYETHLNHDDFQKSSSNLKISYDSGEKKSDYQIIPSGLLFETGITPNWKPNIKQNLEGNWVFFANEASLLGCDVFSMAFWLLSRYEEHQTFEGDKFGRFTSKDALLGGHPALKMPILDIVVAQLAKELKIEMEAHFDVYPTLDIDMGFYYYGKSWARKAAILFRKIRKKPVLNYGLSYKEDPYYTLDYEKNIFKKYNQKNVRYFFLSGQYGKYDKNINLDYAPMSEWVFEAGKYSEVGLHPSYVSNVQPNKINIEKQKLEKSLGKKINRSRQHYLKIKFSEKKESENTYFQLLKYGIVHDYSMGFSDEIGFRAGTARSFAWYNFNKETATTLIVHPFCMMDVTLKNYLKLNETEIIESINEMKSTLKQYNLPFCFIFHNESLSDAGDWIGWRKYFELCLEN